MCDERRILLANLVTFIYALTAFVCVCQCVRTGLSQCTRVEVREQVQKSVPIYYSVGCRDQNWIIKLMAIYLTAEPCQWHERKSVKTKCEKTVSNILK